MRKLRKHIMLYIILKIIIVWKKRPKAKISHMFIHNILFTVTDVVYFQKGFAKFQDFEVPLERLLYLRLRSGALYNTGWSRKTGKFKITLPNI